MTDKPKAPASTVSIKAGDLDAACEMELNVQSPTICFCHGIDKAEICEAIQRGATNIGLIQDATLASTGCGGCELDLEDLIVEMKEAKNI